MGVQEPRAAHEPLAPRLGPVRDADAVRDGMRGRPVRPPRVAVEPGQEALVRRAPGRLRERVHDREAQHVAALRYEFH